MKNAFVTFLGTDNFLPGVLALNESLNRYNKLYALVALVGETVSEKMIAILENKQINSRVVKEIDNPHQLANDERGFKYMYTKLRIFELFEFDKIVYIDADMLVCSNIEALFNHPHLSAVTAGSLHPSNTGWENLNAGLLVVEPRKGLFTRLMRAIKTFPSADGSDQGFLHSFYPGWPSDESLHLGHTFNVPFCYIDDYCRLNDFRFQYKRKSLDTNIAVIHYWGPNKPWEISQRLLKRTSDDKREQSLILWWDNYLIASEGL